MGGKAKQSQRTKNNVRPSSSGRSAGLLNNPGKFDPAPAHMVGGKSMPPLFPTLATVSLDQGLNQEFSMCVKKLNKKDPITKIKALQELTELVNKSDVDEVEAVLPSWTHFYKTLSVDTDWKVREATQASQAAVVRACGRRVAPHLRQLLPAWLLARHDDHAPAQLLAQLSLKDTFPEKKLPEVIIFCKNEIIAQLLDNLIGNGESLIAQRIADPEEREAASARLAASSLRGASWLATHAPPPLHHWSDALLTPLLQHATFWRLAAHRQHATFWRLAAHRQAPVRYRPQPGAPLLQHATFWRLAAHRQAPVRYRPQPGAPLLQHATFWRHAAHRQAPVRYRPQPGAPLLQHATFWRLAAHRQAPVRYRPQPGAPLLQHATFWRLAAHRQAPVRYRPQPGAPLLQHATFWRLAAHRQAPVRYRPQPGAPLLQHATFWRLAAHRQAPVRAAWFSAMGSFVERFKDNFEAAHGRKLLRQVLAATDRATPVAPPLWDCLLLIMHNLQDWHTWLDKNDLLTKRIIDLLENGGWEDAKQLSTLLLPLLAGLPPHLATKEFHIKFFAAIYKGLEKKSIANCKSEREYWIRSASECMGYVSSLEAEYSAEVVSGALRGWVAAALAPRAAAPLAASAAAWGRLLRGWLRAPPAPRLDLLVRGFWHGLAATLADHVRALPADLHQALRLVDAHLLLLRTLRAAIRPEPRRKHGVKFQDEDASPESEERSSPTPECDPDVVERYDHNLHELIEKVCVGYFEFVDNKNIAEPVLKPLTALLLEFDRERTFVGIAKQLGANSVYEFYDNVLRRWLMNDAMRCEAIVDIVFIILKYMTETEQDATMKSFDSDPPYQD
ncbi:E3 ubiquitin-protein ligase listerin [Achroia grisella]|uniref:E3 ubiquitin-protein ligase listerin n=1 Tax=Achroia grisella TaxID=688607 RepID=UPI0027D1F13C|nr:E3 ubiquitin-protein ligase listerin [Achroia grisella]